MALEGVPRLVGREREVALIDATLARAATATGVLVLRGEPGVGTTRLLDEACARATAGGLRVARTGTSPLETGLGYAVLHRLLRPLLLAGPAGARAVLVEDLPALGAVLPSLGPTPASGDPAVDRLRVGESVRVVLERLGRRGAALLAVDDVEDADTATLATLLHVLRSADGLRLAVVLTTHPTVGAGGRAGAADDLVRAAGSLPSTVVHDVAPLAAPVLRDLVADLLADDPPAEVVDHVLAQSQGSPLVVRGVVGTLLATGALSREGGRWVLRPAAPRDDAAVAGPVGLSALVRRRLERLAPGPLLATGLLALAGGRLEHVALVRALRELDPAADPEDTVADIAATALVADESTPRLTYLLTHPVLISGAATRQSPLERRRGHAALARALAETSPDDLDRPALQAALAGDALDPGPALDLLVRATKAALERGDGEAAHRHAEAALVRVGAMDEALTTGLLRDRALALELTGSPGPAVDAWEEVAARSARAARVADHVEAVCHLARLDAENGRPARALERVDALRAGPLWPLATAVVRVPVLDLASGVAQRLPQDRQDLLGELGATAEQSRSPAARRRAVLRLAQDRHDRGDLRGIAQLVDELDSTDHELLRAVAAFELEWRDPHEALRLLDAARPGLAADPYPLDCLRHDEVRLLALVRCDRFDEALDAAEAVRRLADRLGSARSASYAALTRGLVHAHRGKPGPARAELKAARTAYPPLDGTDRHLTGYADLLQAQLDLASGRPQAVVARFRDRPVRSDGGIASIAEANLVLGQALRRTGDTASLATLARALQERLPHHPAAGALAERVAGWAAAEEGRLPEAVELLGSSAARLSALGLLREAASARLDAAELDDPARATDVVRQALTVLETLGCAPEAGRARRLLRRGGTSPSRRRPGDLTERELEVALLVAQGLTDAEIARRLYLSPRTVTTHLQHAYFRLGLSGRTALARHVLERHVPERTDT